MPIDWFPPAIRFEESSIQEAQAPLYPDEEVAVARAIEKRRLEFCAGRTCARRALSALGQSPLPLPANADRSPRWPDGFVGSITHSANYAAAAAARRHEIRSIGIDAEMLSRVTPEIHDRILVAAELEWISKNRGPGETHWPAMFFSAKESFYKLQRPLTGKFLEFHEVQIHVMPDQQRFTVKTLRRTFDCLGDLSQIQGRYQILQDKIFTAMWLPTS